MKKKGGLYVYGIVGAEPSEPLGRGLAGEDLRLIGEGGVRAVAGEMGEAPRVDPATLTAHDAAFTFKLLKEKGVPGI